MNDRVLNIARAAGLKKEHGSDTEYIGNFDWREFAQLLKQAIYDEVKQELIEDVDIKDEYNPMVQEYLKGCNGGTVDALCHIKNFGEDIEL